MTFHKKMDGRCFQQLKIALRVEQQADGTTKRFKGRCTLGIPKAATA
jgi:hypothetical protein